jgi:hypothetical protein
MKPKAEETSNTNISNLIQFRNDCSLAPFCNFIRVCAVSRYVRAVSKYVRAVSKYVRLLLK